MLAGVTPEDGETLTPASVEETVNSTFPPPGLRMVTSCAATRRSQYPPRNTRSSWLATTRFAEFREPTGSTVTPLSEIAYISEPSAFKRLLPARFSGNCSVSRTVKLSRSQICNTGGSTATGVEPGTPCAGAAGGVPTQTVTPAITEQVPGTGAAVVPAVWGICA